MSTPHRRDDTQLDGQTRTRVAAMREGGKRLADVRDRLVGLVKPGISFADIEAEAQRLIRAHGARPNFAMVPGYHWATCLMRNDEVCHGIPIKEKMIEDGDLVKIDVGLLYEGFHVDTTASVWCGKVPEKYAHFLEYGQLSLDRAIAQAIPGNSVYDISFQMEKVLTRHSLGAVYQLTGHGIGRELHEDPSIPCFAQKRDKRVLLRPWQTVAIEVMYTAGHPDLKIDSDGWTYRTVDGSLGGMIEETVLVTPGGPEVLTRAN